MTATSTSRPREWHRFSPTERIMRSAFYLMALLAIVWSIRSIEIIPEFLYDAPQQTVDLFARMWPIDWAWYPKVVHAALLETLHTATLGTLLAVLIAKGEVGGLLADLDCHTGRLLAGSGRDVRHHGQHVTPGSGRSGQPAAA